MPSRFRSHHARPDRLWTTAKNYPKRAANLAHLARLLAILIVMSIVAHVLTILAAETGPPPRSPRDGLAA